MKKFEFSNIWLQEFGRGLWTCNRGSFHLRSSLRLQLSNWITFGEMVWPWLQSPASWGLVELLNDGCLEYNIAAIFGVSRLATLGMMPKGQNVGDGEGDMQQLLPWMSKPKNSQTRSEMGR